MAEARRCPECGAALPDQAPEGMCPKCLLEGGLGDADGNETQAEAVVSPTGAGEQDVPAEIAGYRIIRLIGVGGMGTVYEAQQAHPQRTVALKVLKPHLATAELLHRFAHEAEVLGRLQHPGIAQVYESGTAEMQHGPQPFFSMEFICGPEGGKAPTLTEYADEQGLDTRQRLELPVRRDRAAEDTGLRHRADHRQRHPTDDDADGRRSDPRDAALHEPGTDRWRPGGIGPAL